MASGRRFACDQTGSLVAPPWLPARASTADLDVALAELLTLQRDCWLGLATDGQLWRLVDDAPPLVERVRRAAGLSPLPLKVALPADPSDGGLVDEVLVRTVLEAGASYVQLDGRAYWALMHGATRRAMQSTGLDPDRLMALRLERDRARLIALPRDERTKLAVCFHDPEDPAAPPFAVDLDADAARTVLHGLPVDRYHFDAGGPQGRAAGYGFLALAPEAAEVALGLIDAGAPNLPHADELVAQLDLAARVIDADRLSLCPRHGLGTLASIGPEAAWTRQRDVLELLMDAASRAWGLDL